MGLEQLNFRIEDVQITVDVATNTGETADVIIPSAVDSNGTRHLSAESYLSGRPIYPPVVEV